MTFNWSWNAEFSGSFRPELEQLRFSLGALDGHKDGIFALWRLPVGVAYRDLDQSDGWPHEYMQSGGSADAMNIELRRLEDDGEYHQYAVARPLSEPGERDVVWHAKEGERRVTVPVAEVFNSDQAAAVYFAYYTTGAVPEGYHLRPLEPDPSDE